MSFTDNKKNQPDLEYGQKYKLKRMTSALENSLGIYLLASLSKRPVYTGTPRCLLISVNSSDGSKPNTFAPNFFIF